MSDKSKDIYKNPYEAGTPEWQLWEGMRSNESLANTFASEAEASLKKAASAREKAGKFRNALIKLTGTEFTILKAVDANAQLTIKNGKKDGSGSPLT